MTQPLTNSPNARPKSSGDVRPRPVLSAHYESGESNPLNHRQLAAARAMAAGQSFQHAARAVGVSERTLFRWRKLEAFAAELRRLHERLALASVDRPQGIARSSNATQLSSPKSRVAAVDLDDDNISLEEARALFARTRSAAMLRRFEEEQRLRQSRPQRRGAAALAAAVAATIGGPSTKRPLSR